MLHLVHDGVRVHVVRPGELIHYVGQSEAAVDELPDFARRLVEHRDLRSFRVVETQVPVYFRFENA